MPGTATRAESNRVLTRLPNLVIAGVSKAGTTSLFRYLAQHPEIFPADLKEVRYFFPLRFGRPLPPVHTYVEHFRGWSDERYAMEATPGYLYGGAAIAQAMDDLLPDVRVVVSLRDPVERFLSYYEFVSSRLRIPAEMDVHAYLRHAQALRLAGEDHRKSNLAYWGLAGGFYDEWLGDWLERFGPRLQVVFFEHLVADPPGVVADLCRWLGLDDRPTAAFDYRHENRTVRPRNRLLQRAMLAANRRSYPFFVRHPQLKVTLRNAYHRINADSGHHPTRTDDIRERLRPFYAETTAHLAATLHAAGYDELPAWVSQEMG